MATMSGGEALVQSLGAKVAEPDRPVLYVVGDGGFMFSASELSTAVQYGINVVTVVFRDDAYGNVACDLDKAFGGTYETSLHNPDLVKFAESFGAVRMRAEDPADLATLLRRRSNVRRRCSSTYRSGTSTCPGPSSTPTSERSPGPSPKGVWYSPESLE